MKPFPTLAASTLLAGASIALAAVDRPRLAIVALAAAVLLLTFALSLSLRRNRR